MRSAAKFKSRRLRYIVILASATTIAWLTLAAPAPAALVERALPAYDESLTGQTDAAGTYSLNAFGRTADENQRNETLLGFIPERDDQTAEEERRDSDWCLWFALLASAAQIADPSFDPSTNTPEGILVNNIVPCLAKHIPSLGIGGATVAARILAVQNQIQLVQSQTPTLSASDALSWIEQNGLSFDPQTWANWFTFAADSLPPSSTV